MSTGSSLQTAGDVAAAASEYASKINEMADTATTLAKEGKELSQVQNLLQDVEVFGKAATALGAVGAGLSIVTTLMGVKSAAEQNTELLGELKKQITQLGTELKRQIENIDTQADMRAATTRWDNMRDDLRDWRNGYSDYIDGKRDADASYLLESSQGDVIAKAREIADWLEQPLAQENMLIAIYNSSFGNESSILAFGTSMLKDAYFLQVLCVCIGQLAKEPGLPHMGEVLDEATVNLRMASVINRISAAITKYSNMCNENCWKNSDNYLKERKFPKLELAWADYYTKNCKDIGEDLQSRWPRYDWSVVVYDWVGGFDRHGIMSKGIWCKPYFKQECKATVGNFIIAAAWVEAPQFNPDSSTDIANAWYDLTLNARATMVVKNSLEGFQSRNRNGFFFYCKKEGQPEGVRMNYWSKALRRPQWDTRTNISINSQGCWQQGRIISSFINTAWIDGGGHHHNSDTYYQLIHMTA